MRANFTECAALFSANTTQGAALRDQWGWQGPIVGILRNNYTQISRAGCKAICGSGPDYYHWTDVSSTITTWILPIVGTLLQAPFESNEFGRTVLAIMRWVGSPIASLSYVLWNIKVSAKAALMVDMAVAYGLTPERKTDFGSMRDSMYLLLAMNQYSMKAETAVYKKETEGLLRIVLFSKDLELTDTDKSLRQMRRILARELREMRRRGAVPVFVSTMWFLFAFALSIQAAFGDFGQNRTAHDLALGCLLAWFPILIMSSIVDRNPIAANAIRKKLNALVDHVRHALQDKKHRDHFLDSFADQPEYHSLKKWVENVANRAEYMDGFFVEFAGQARQRWHYGAAHPILSDIENCYIADKKRNWLADEKSARTSLVLGEVNEEGLIWFDIREYWQIASAIIIVGASCGGAFILSFFTPTVGLGCRSGGYVIFFSISLGLLIVEMTVWMALSPYQPQLLTRTATILHNNARFDKWDYAAHSRWVHLKRQTSNIMLATRNWSIRSIVRLAILLPWKDKEATGERLEGALNAWVKRLHAMSLPKRWEWFFFRPVEAINASWLIYIVVAQTFGSYKSCDCVTSNWGGAGGYLDFGIQDISTTEWVAYYWMTGTFLTSIVMGLAMFYITVEWCQQSFLSTEDYIDAMNGLRMTRIYRHWTFPFRLLSRFITKYTLGIVSKLLSSLKLIKVPQKTLLWEKRHTWNPAISYLASITETRRPDHRTNPSIELTDFSIPTERNDPQHVQETPATAHSLFPPASSKSHSRQDSDSSVLRSSSPTFRHPSHEYMGSPLSEHANHESHVSLIPRPAEIHPHTYRKSVGSAVSDEESRHSSEYYGSPSSLDDPLLGRSGGIVGVQSRQGYARANSDPGSPTTEAGLGIQFYQRDRDVEKGYGAQ
ncbi:hypothetical protein P280DRAFT_413855 [Massarina eburnea CBS 473.64]|uniref:Uncharacterized protein n=1 Tax=Massarina eburnea CBS 473.64 TaxID=1395130 RepID=A0A6A6RGQ6_9PLEO|nr:hypothetical protein P280DRAFT_413855 [Massarina eburnea CBS 473.64]